MTFDREQAIEVIARSFAESVTAITVRRGGEPVDVCRFHRDLAEDFVDALDALPPFESTNARWCVYRFECPVAGCQNGFEQADHHRRDPDAMRGPQCHVHRRPMEFVARRPLYESRVVDDAMVERAAKVLQRRFEETGEDEVRAWDSPEIDEDAREAFREDARAALLAALSPEQATGL